MIEIFDALNAQQHYLPPETGSQPAMFLPALVERRLLRFFYLFETAIPSLPPKFTDRIAATHPFLVLDPISADACYARRGLGC